MRGSAFRRCSQNIDAAGAAPDHKGSVGVAAGGALVLLASCRPCRQTLLVGLKAAEKSDRSLLNRRAWFRW